MRRRDAPEIQAIGQLCGNLVALGAGLGVVWSTAVAFAGGRFPLTAVHVAGGIRTGLLWTFVADPVLVSVAVLVAYVLVGVASFVVPVAATADDGDGVLERGTGSIHGVS
ncbi:MAG TPA: hypothetical protein VFC33_08475 [Acidimicrobiia bacterium]|nr:hypothetical protein [Acidimicrobiia bacterium]